ncbi:tRNA-intron lyase [Candidatus Bathyarchaeota archaeon]|nr:tRNA-intron lyase [Candidatus Bathyarchaeota archaeon]
MEVESIENFLIVWNTAHGSELYKMGFYGKPLGIAKPKIPEFNAPLILDLMEGLYLAEKRKITVYEGTEKRKVSVKTLRQRAKSLYEDFEEKYAVYYDLRDSGLIVTPGIKFGCDFAVYKHGPGVEHAPFMVSVKSAKSEITATEIVKAGRLATTVRKRFIIAVPDIEKEKVRYLMFKWFKA